MLAPYPSHPRVIWTRCDQPHCDSLDDRQVEIQLD